jgi:predicted double-glycine peptidase
MGKKMCWLETTLVIAIILLSAWGGYKFSRIGNLNWCWGYFIPSALIILLTVSTYISLNTYFPTLVWISGSRMRFIIIGLASAMGAMTLFGRIHNRIEKYIVLILTMGVIIWGSVLPFLIPALIQKNLTNLQTKFDADNICSQSTDYTCGPAAAVTALRQLGFSAQEGEMAVLSRTTPFSGTMPWCLYKAIQNRYSSQGLRCEFRHFDSVDELRQSQATLVVIKDAFMLDHCVAILKVSDDSVIIGDPVLGKITMSYKDFADVWRFYGISLTHNPS